MKIGILGSGLMGGKLGTIFAWAGHEVVFSYSHSRDKLEKLALDAGGKARAGTPAEAAKDAEAVLLAVHWDQFDDVLRQAGNLSGKILMTCSLPMNPKNTDMIIGFESSGAEELAQRVPAARVVSVFNTIPSEVLFGVYKSKKTPKPSLVFCSDYAEAKKIVAPLIKDVGFEPVDLGKLKMARYTEPFAMMVAQIAYEGKGGPELAYRFEKF